MDKRIGHKVFVDCINSLAYCSLQQIPYEVFFLHRVCNASTLRYGAA